MAAWRSEETVDTREQWAYVQQWPARGRMVTEAFHDRRDGSPPVLRDDFPDVEDALAWLEGRAARITVGVPDREMYSAGPVALAGLPEWPPPPEVREAMRAEGELMLRPVRDPAGPEKLEVRMAVVASLERFPDPAVPRPPGWTAARNEGLARVVEIPWQPRECYDATWELTPGGEIVEEETFGPTDVLAEALAWGRTRCRRVSLQIRSRGRYSAGASALWMLPRWPPSPRVMAAIEYERGLLRRLDSDRVAAGSRGSLLRELRRSVARNPDRLPGGGFVVPRR